MHAKENIKNLFKAFILEIGVLIKDFDLNLSKY